MHSIVSILQLRFCGSEGGEHVIEHNDVFLRWTIQERRVKREAVGVLTWYLTLRRTLAGSDSAVIHRRSILKCELASGKTGPAREPGKLVLELALNPALTSPTWYSAVGNCSNC
jgi:hypothetical protein